jgi:hypothetical protein
MRICFVFVLLVSGAAEAADDLDVLPKGTDKLLFEHLKKQSKQLYAKRDAEVAEALRSPEAVKKRGERLLRDYRRLIGELPKEKTPLNAKVRQRGDSKRSGDDRTQRLDWLRRPL